MHSPRSESGVYPSITTPGCTKRNSFEATRRYTAERDIPRSMSCSMEATPCQRVACRAIARFRARRDLVRRTGLGVTDRSELVAEAAEDVIGSRSRVTFHAMRAVRTRCVTTSSRIRAGSRKHRRVACASRHMGLSRNSAMFLWMRPASRHAAARRGAEGKGGATPLRGGEGRGNAAAPPQWDGAQLQLCLVPRRRRFGVGGA
jgi:hypothetical protein